MKLLFVFLCLAFYAMALPVQPGQEQRSKRAERAANAGKEGFNTRGYPKDKPCIPCGTRYVYHSHLRSHTERIHQQNHECLTCGAWYTHMQGLREHEELMHGIRLPDVRDPESRHDLLPVLHDQPSLNGPSLALPKEWGPR